MCQQRKRSPSQEVRIATLTDIEREKRTTTNRRRLRYIIDKGREIECSLNIERFSTHPSCEILNSLARGAGLNGLFVNEIEGATPISVKNDTLVVSLNTLKTADQLLSSTDCDQWRTGFDYLIDFFKFLDRAKEQTRIREREPTSIAHQKAWAIRDGLEKQLESAARAFLILEYLNPLRGTLESIEQAFSEIGEDSAKKVLRRIQEIKTE